MGLDLRRIATLAAIAASAALLAGCELERGVSGRDAEWGRLRPGPFSVVNASHERTVVSANGRQVAIEAAEGFCVMKESIQMTGRSAFTMIGDCVTETPLTATLAGGDELDLPPAAPALITVSISGDPGFTGSGATGSLDDLQAYLQTNDGRALLGRSGSGETVSVQRMRQIGGALYVLVEDKDAEVVPILAPQFWRAFTDLNERLTVVTISAFRDRPLDQDEMLKYLVTQVQTLAQANLVPLDEPVTVVAQAPPSAPAVTEDVQSLEDLEPETVVVATVRPQSANLWPTPRRRPTSPATAPTATSNPARDSARGAAPSDRSSDPVATKNAPERAPLAPRRPARV